MGFFFSNLHVRRTDAFSLDRFCSVLAELLGKRGYSPAADPESADLSVSVYDAGGAWISVCTDGIEFYTEESISWFCKPLSVQLDTDLLSVSCFDSDCLLMNLNRAGRGTDAWAKVGTYPGLRMRSAPAKWKGLVENLSQWKAALSRKYVFAEEVLDDIEPLLGLEPGQGRFCCELMTESPFAGQVQSFSFSLPETAARPEPPRLAMPMYDGMACEMGQPKFISAVNKGGKSQGLAVAFSGSYVEQEEIRFRDVRLEYDFDRYPRPSIPLRLEKRQTEDGRWIYYAEIPQFQLLPGVKDGLSPMKAMNEEFRRSFGLRFTPEGNERKRLDITLHFIPLKNPSGQCGWCVWLPSGSRKEFIERHNRTWSAIPSSNPELMDCNDFDIDD